VVLPPRYYGQFAPANVDWYPPERKRVIAPASNDSVGLLAFDPGGTTGWSLMTLPREIDGRNIFDHEFKQIIVAGHGTWEHGQINCTESEDEGFYAIRKLIDLASHAAVITERFILAKNRNEKQDTLLSPERLNALIKHHLWCKGRELFGQTTGVVKPAMTDARLRHFKVFTSKGSLNHARDADRHLLYFIKRCMTSAPRHEIVRHKAWPHIFGENGDLLVR
jgi:hypothetical protein